MAAHLRALPRPRCAWGLCRTTASNQLFNTFNAPQGVYCRVHAKHALARFIAEHPEQGPVEGR